MNIQVNLIFLKVYIWTLSYQNQFVKKILWIFSPKFAPYLHLFSRSYTTLYDCVDYVWDPIPTVNDAVRKQENSLIRSVDFMVVNSHVLYDAHKTKKKNIVLVQLGFRLDSLKKNILTKHRDPLFYDKPIIGFIGVINYRLDYSLLYRVAANNPRWNFVFYGPQEVSVYGGMVRVQGAIDRLTKLPNVFFRERTAPDVAHDVIRVFDICMIPYNTAYPINRYCYPMKLFEYFYMGKPVISTPIEELRRFPKYVKIGKSVNKWENHIEKILSKPWPKRYKKEQKLLAVENSWDKKISYIASLIK
jgi:glycosyltransferase involved in cell wall biosynthesis